MPLLLIVFALIAAIPAVFIYDSILTGEVKAKLGSYRRAEDPVWFWIIIGMYAAMLAGIAYLALDLAFSDWS